MGSTGGALDDGDGRIEMLGHFPGKAELRSDDIVDGLEVDPAFGTHFIFPSDAVGEFDLGLRGFQSSERREAGNVCDFGIRADHVGLSGEDEDADGVLCLDDEITQASADDEKKITDA